MATKKVPRKLHIDPASTTVAQVQEKMRAAVREGVVVVCPCCKQEVKVEERSLTPMMAKTLVILHRHFKTNPEWLQVPEFIVEANKLGAMLRGSDWTRLKYWGLLEERVASTRNDGSKKAGYYKMLDAGHRFASGETKAPKTVRLYNGHFIGFGEGLVGIQECLGEDVELAQLMAGNYGAFIV